MAKQSRWVKCRLECPEGMGETELFIEWHAEGEEELLNGITCNNAKLRDLSGRECRWSCWGKITPED